MKQDAPADKRQTILCVEDEADLRRDIAEVLEEAGYDVLQADGGEQALALLAITRPDLILCDIAMPSMNGYQVLAAVRTRYADHAETPFVFLSAYAQPRHVIEGKKLGADDYLVKPIDHQLMLATVQARLRQIARIRDARMASLHDLTAADIADQLDLTPAESRVALALVDGLSLNDIATELDVARSTVAYHLGNLFAKTGTARQAELVAFILKSVRT